MNKRSDTIRSLFMTTADAQLSADNKATSRVASGPVRSMRESFSGIERENERLREQMASGRIVLELDPGLIDPSPLSDRFVDSDGASFEALKSSISQRGQEVPVLVRQHPEVTGRYQTAYGHRRIRAARELGRQVRAIVKEMNSTYLAPNGERFRRLIPKAFNLEDQQVERFRTRPTQPVPATERRQV